VSVSLVARRYATALLEIGTDSGILDSIVADLSNAASAYEASAELRASLENPLVAHEAKKAVVAEIATTLGIGEVARHTLQLLVDRRRVAALPYIARYLHELNDAKKGLLRAEVTTATPLTDAYYARLQAQLEKMTGKKVAIDRKVDPSIIAGVVTRIGDRIYDGSVKSRLVSMKDTLLPTH
jgi:F-type H+-transporting ATPase subunit delta